MRVTKPPGCRLATAVLLLLAACAALAAAPATSHAQACSTPVTNEVACENSKPGTNWTDWEVVGPGDPALQGYATEMSVQAGDTINFKIKATSSNYHIDVLRLGYYGGDGARKLASNLAPTGTSTQPACLQQASTGLIDCGNWAVTRSWTVPADAVSGVYIAHLVNNNDPEIESHITFVVRDDDSDSDIVLQTSDETWQAYNRYGGNSLYACDTVCPAGEPLGYKAAYKVSYNRPLRVEEDSPPSALFRGAEYSMIRFLEANGYDMSYVSGVDTHARGQVLQNHRLFISSGHDEYWSGPQRTNVENARDAGVNLAFFAGNLMFWKTRFESSIDGANRANRTLVSYKDTHFPAQQDPVSWTGTWRDSRFTNPADNVTPENAVTGTSFLVNSGTSRLTVPYAYRNMRLWRNTDAANLALNQTLNLAPDTLGYEWDVDADNGFRPAGTFKMSSTTVSGLEVFTDYGSSVKLGGTATHNLTMYRAPSGARVFSAGTVQWAFGLDDNFHPSATPDRNMRQATLNLFADMGVQPYALMPGAGLVRATRTTDTAKPTSTINAPPANVQDGNQLTISGTASDAGGGVVGGVEVSTDGGESWHPATGTTSWSYTWIAHGHPSTTIRSRATDDSGNIETPTSSATINVACPCSLWGPNTSVPSDKVDSGDPTPVEVGVKFRSDSYGTVSGMRFYKAAANTGTHVGSLWTAGGQRLAQATFTGETASGWQTVTFSSPVEVQPNTTYVASYHAPNGHYSATGEYFYRTPAPGPNGGADIDSAPLHGVRNADGETNGLFSYSAASTFPVNSYAASNYWVDVIYTPARGPRRGDERLRGGRRPHLGQRGLVGPGERRHGDLLPDHPVRREPGADAQDRRRLRHRHDHDRADDGDDLHLPRGGAEPERLRRAVGSVGPGDPARPGSARASHRRQRARRVAVRSRELDGAVRRRRQPDHRLHRDPVRRDPVAESRAGRGVSDERDRRRAHERHCLHVPREREQRRRIEPPVGAVRADGAAGHDLRLRDADDGRRRRPEPGRARREVHARLQRVDHGRAVLQVVREHRHATAAVCGRPPGRAWPRRRSPARAGPDGSPSPSRARCPSPPAPPTSPRTSRRTAITR